MKRDVRAARKRARVGGGQSRQDQIIIPDDQLTPDALAARYGLAPVGRRPALLPYIREIVRWLPFTVMLGTSRAASKNRNSYLGQIWSFLNPILNSLVYVLVFGLLLDVSRGVDNVIGFIVVGTFMYRSFNDVVQNGGRSIRRNQNLVKSLPFPRAVMPIAAAVSEAVMLLPELLVMLIIIKVSSAIPNMTPVIWDWTLILLIPAVILLYIFSLGVAFMVARVISFIPDLGNLLPFCLRLLMYTSGAIFPVSRYFSNETIQNILSYQPVAVMLDLVRQVTLSESTIPFTWSHWLWATGWAVSFFTIGLVIFWRAEARYGRE
ncbi:teichoic acid transport system permease protein [Micrococcales bacterium KH10]|nr:teichoic acid transport system permease protein [Micrococcales bacterium KH10]